MNNEKGQEAHEIFTSDFCKKDLVEGKWVIAGPKMLCPQNSRFALKDLFIILCNERGKGAQANIYARDIPDKRKFSSLVKPHV